MDLSVAISSPLLLRHGRIIRWHGGISFGTTKTSQHFPRDPNRKKKERLQFSPLCPSPPPLWWPSMAVQAGNGDLDRQWCSMPRSSFFPCSFDRSNKKKIGNHRLPSLPVVAAKRGWKLEEVGRERPAVHLLRLPTDYRTGIRWGGELVLAPISTTWPGGRRSI